MINATLAKHLNEIGDLLELANDNPFRIRAFRRAAQTIESYPEDLGPLTREERLAIPGIGKGIADVIEEYQAKGDSAEHAKFKKKFPDGVLQMMHLGGVGPKRAARLYRELRIDSLVKLEAAAKKGALQKLEGFGEKLEEKVLKNIAFAQTASNRLLIPHAHQLAAGLKRYLSKCPHIHQLEMAGSARRWKETVGDLDFVCSSARPESAIDHFLKAPGVSRTLASGKTKSSVVLDSGFQCDFRVVEAASFGAALLYFTGSKEHNVRLRELALKKGYTLNEYGLFHLKDKDQKKPVAGRTEEEIYKRLGSSWIPPELREDRGEIEAGLAHKLPRLVSLEDVLGDFHNHTTLSDGAHTLEQMVEAAREHNWKWFFSADHSPSLKIANGLSVERIKKKMADVKKLDRSSKNIRVFIISEVDILGDGKMDYSDDILEELDCVVASVHSRFNQSEEEMTERILNAINNPHVNILGHISGRLIHKRDGYAVNVETILQAARKTQTAVEINGQPERQELNDAHVKRAVELGVPLALNTDAHSMQELEHMVTAVHIARRGWAEPKNILNTLSADEILSWLS